ncbi:hypothetical protein [Sphingobacterium sp. UBA5996]|uniref:hypothetical protein n=1 Tax=Sphingobacterium sp. UBA5996 TaxID=1947505 RepID=UPI0025D44787|nr:hypothetical protein [Sphingobacterium sp. UBA5996]
MKTHKIRLLFCTMMAWAICLQSTNLLWVYIGFEANRSYIEQNLCVYRYMPAATCKGFCYLSEKSTQEQHTANFYLYCPVVEVLTISYYNPNAMPVCPGVSTSIFFAAGDE